MTNKKNRRAFLRKSGATITLIGFPHTGLVTEEPSVDNYQVTTQQQKRASSWPMFQYDARNSGAPNTTGPKEPVEAKWTFETNGALRAQPIIADGSVFLASTDTKVYSISVTTGDEQWSIGTNKKLDAAPAVANGILYVPTNTGRLLALSAGTGSGQWTANTGDPKQTGVTIRNEIISIGASGGEFDNTYYYGFDSGTGDQLWEVQPGLSDAGPPLISGGSVYTACSEAGQEGFAQIVAYDLSTQEKQWQIDYDSSGIRIKPIYPEITLNEGTIYFGSWSSSSSLYAISAETGDRQWQFENIGEIKSAPVYANDTVYVTTQSDNRVHAVDPVIGTRKWQNQVDGTPTSPVVVDGTVYFGATDNKVYAYDGVSGEQLWTFTTGGSIVAPPAVLDGTVYVASEDNVLYALREKGKISPGDVTGDGNPAQDLDDDGLYEDVNGDGAFTIVDVQALFAHLESDTVQNSTPKFDFNGDGKVDVTDVQALYNLLQE